MSEHQPTSRGLQAVSIVRDLLVRMGAEMPFKEQQFSRGTLFLMTFDGPATRGLAYVYTDVEQFSFMLVFNGRVPPEARSRVSEYLGRVNWELMAGGFCLNFEDGAVAYKASIDFANVGLAGPSVRNVILAGMENVEQYAQGVVDVAEGKVNPRSAQLAARTAGAASAK